MGRRIPKSKKHKKLKFVDPCYRGSHKALKKNVNEPPSYDQDQEVPRSAKEMMEATDKMRQSEGKRKIRKSKIKDDFVIVNNNFVHTEDMRGSEPKPKKIKQGKNESDYGFYNRLQKMADQAIAEANVEEKYNIKVVDVAKDGTARFVHDDMEGSQRKKEKRKKFREKKAEKKKLKFEENAFELKKDKIRFGEVVNAPPRLKAKPKKAPDIVKAGKKQLHLKKLISTSSEKAGSEKVASTSTKWKHLPNDKRNAVEWERSRAVQMYRILKNKKAAH